jgi:hypothetical protein
MPAEMTDHELRRHHRRARKAPIAEWKALGVEHAKEDALACFSGVTLSDKETVQALQRQRMADRRRRLVDAGVSKDRIAAWLNAHTLAFAKRLGELRARDANPLVSVSP